jgi:hypothetical protein
MSFEDYTTRGLRRPYHHMVCGVSPFLVGYIARIPRTTPTMAHPVLAVSPTRMPSTPALLALTEAGLVLSAFPQMLVSGSAQHDAMLRSQPDNHRNGGLAHENDSYDVGAASAVLEGEIYWLACLPYNSTTSTTSVRGLIELPATSP